MSKIFEQVKSAYNEMATKARYRPAAPSDGFGNIAVPKEQLNLKKEAESYAKQWLEEEDTCKFFVGHRDYYSHKAMIYAIEAARNMCAGRLGDVCALRLLKMAVTEMERVNKMPEVKQVHQALNV